MKFKKLALITFSLIVSLILLELGLRFVVPLLINLPYRNKIYDDKLGHTVNKSLSGIDENGFGNPEILEQADIVVLGDSHTYGIHVNSEQSWPQQLAKMANMTVYNFGVGGYGSLQYYYLMEEALKLKPKHIMIGLYLANDLNDVCKLISKMQYWQVRLEELGYNVETCFKSYKKPSILKQMISNQHLSLLTVYGLKKIYKWSNFGGAVNIREETFSTIIKNKRIASNKSKMDLERESIHLGFEITKDILKVFNRKANLDNIEFSVVIIPSKERVFFDYLTERGYQLPNNYSEMVDNEIKLVDMFSYFFNEQGIKFVDAKPYVEQQIYKSKPVYPPSSNGHPVGIGYHAYATAAFNCIFTENKNTDGKYCNSCQAPGKQSTF